MGATSSIPKTAELETAENPADSRVPKDQDCHETDSLLPEKVKQALPDDMDEDDCDYTLGMKPFVTRLGRHYGCKLLWMLFAAQFLLKGFAVEFSARAEPYLYKLYHVPASQMQIFQGVSKLPWAIKPIIGLASDLFPILGYNKAPYMLLASVLGLVAFLIVGFSSPETLAVNLLVGCFIAIQFQASTCDLLTEAKYAEKIRETPQHGPSMLTYVWFGCQAASLVAVILAGGAIGRLGPHALYIIAAFPAAAVIIPVWMNYMDESPLSSKQRSEAWARFMSQGETIVLCGLMLIATLVLSTVSLTSGSTLRQAVCAITVAVVIVTGVSVLLNPTIAKFIAFSVVQSSLTFSIQGAAFYFYTDTQEQYPEGPHFSPFFYNSVVGVVTYICSLIGIYTYQRYMTNWKYRSIFIAGNLGYSIICLPDMILFSRYNLVLGIPDHVFVLGSTIAENIIGSWQWMPQVVILANLCPKGMEATMYALLAGCYNLGSGIGSYLGALMLELLSCNPTGAIGESAKFDNLWKASAISCTLPFITILALFWLIPDKRQDENILQDNTATSGSIWRRWTGRDQVLPLS